MTTDSSPALGDRIARTLGHLGIHRAHFGTRSVSNLSDLVSSHPDAIASLTLPCPDSFDAAALFGLRCEVLLFRGDRGSGARGAGATLAGLPRVTRHTLADYEDVPWADTAADRTEPLATAMGSFLERVDSSDPLPVVDAWPAEGEVDGIAFRALGSGSPLVLLPMGLAPSQWEPVLPALSEHHYVIILGGPLFHPIKMMESRAQSGYAAMVMDVLAQAGLAPGLAVLEAGCGSGALLRRVAKVTAGAGRITGVDRNRYVLSEAAVLARRDGLDAVITFQEGKIEALPFPENEFDLVYCSTVLEEVDADRAIAELVRVTRPGGRVAAVVRSVDRPNWVHLPLSPAVAAKAEGNAGAVVANGCADAGLADRLTRAGLAQVWGYPYLVTVPFDHPWAPHLEALTLGRLSPEEAQEWRAAVQQVRHEGSHAWMARPFHCALGTKPG